MSQSENRPNELFISYARLNEIFVTPLINAIKQNNIDPWFDVDDIPKGQAWWLEIQKGIDGANGFVFIISEASLRSKVCNWELAHAFSQSKKIIPVLYEDVFQNKKLMQDLSELNWDNLDNININAQTNWDKLQSLNFIRYCDDNDIPNSVDTIIQVARTDFKHVAEHTRLLQRAVEWDKKNRNTGFLLTSDEIKEAEEWQSKATINASEPIPSPLHLEYIQQSRARQKIRARRFAIGSVITASIIILISLFAYISSQSATENKDAFTSEQRRANTEEDQKESLRLANLAIDEQTLASDGTAELATLLAIRALKTAYTSEADAALVASIEQFIPHTQFTPHTDWIFSLAVSPNNQFILSGVMDGSLLLWRVESGEIIHAFEGHTKSITSVSFNTEGTLALSGSSDNTIRLWDIQNGQMMQVFEGHTKAVTSVAFSPDDMQALSGSNDNTIRLWDVESGETIQVFEGYEDWITSVAFSPNQQHIALGTSDFVQILDIETGEIIQTMTSNRGRIKSIAISSDGKWLIYGTEQALSAPPSSSDNTVQLWDLETGNLVQIFDDYNDWVNSVAFSPDDSLILAGGGSEVHVIDIDSRSNVEIFRVTHVVWSVAFSPDGQFVVAGSGLFQDGGIDEKTSTVDLWRVNTSSIVTRFGGNTNSGKVAFSPDGQFIAASSPDGIRISDVNSGQALNIIQTGNVTSIAFSPDGERIVAGTHEIPVLQYDAITGEWLHAFIGHESRITNAMYSEDGQYLFTGAWDGFIFLWDAKPSEQFNDPLQRFEMATSLIKDVSINPSGKLMVTASNELGELVIAHLWNIESGEILAELEGHTDSVTSVAFSSDGQYILTGSSDRTIRLWDVKTRQTIRVLEGHTDAVNNVAFSPDNQYILTGSDDTTIRLWDIDTGENFRTIIGHTGSVTDVTFSSDGKFILSGSADKTVRLWSTNYQELIDDACANIYRDFTEAERLKYSLDSTPTCD